jgi:hypothetical protein
VRRVRKRHKEAAKDDRAAEAAK